MKQDKFFFSILLVIIPLYFLQGWLFGHGSALSQGIVAIWLLIDMVYLIRYVRKGLWETVGRIFLIFWLLQTLTWIITPMLTESVIHGISWGNTYSIFKNISIVFLSYFPFYVLKVDNAIDKKQIKILAFIAMLCLIAAFFISARESVFSRGTSDITNNGAYYLVVIIPLLGIFFDDFIEFFFYGGLAVLILMGAKRGAILCAFVELILFIYFYYKKTQKKRSFINYIWILVALIIVSYVVVEVFNSSDYLQERYDQTRVGDSSLRDEIYSLAILRFDEQDLIAQLFGNGMSSTLSIIGGYAHQDWLELLINNGVLGVFLYVLVFITLFVCYHNHKKSMSFMERFMFLSATFGWLLRSMYSMGYVSIETSFYTIAFGFLCAKQRQQLINNNNEYLSNNSRRL